jgi:serine/threonine protein kinase
VAVARVVMTQLLEALRDLHAIRVVHRDVKPANLVLVEHERRLKVRRRRSDTLTRREVGR